MQRRADGRFQKKIKLPNGKIKFLYSSAKSERAATADFNKQIVLLETERIHSMNFDRVAEAWGNERFRTIQHNTQKLYRTCKNEAVVYFGAAPIADISTARIRAYLNMLSDKGYSKKTIKERYAVLKQIFTFALENEYMEKNPCSTVKLKFSRDMDTHKREAATNEEESIIRTASNSIPFVFFAKFLLYTGCRRGEALALSPKDVDVDNNIVVINKTVEWVGNNPRIKQQPKTLAGNREIPLPFFLIDELKKRKKQKFLFQNDSGDMLTNSQITTGWSKLKKEIKINCTPHQLRHSYATMLFDAGIDVKTAQRWLGHSDVKTTLDTYTHLSDLRKLQATEKWFNFLDEVVKK